MRPGRRNQPRFQAFRAVPVGFTSERFGRWRWYQGLWRVAVLVKLENLVGRRRYALVADQRATLIQLADSVVAEPQVIAQDPLIVLT